MPPRARARIRAAITPALLATLGFALVCGCAPEDAAMIRLATTTSTENSGLLGAILPPFERETGITVQVIAVGTGQALELGRRGDVDLVLVHAREREDAFVAAGHGIDRRDVMWNDFVILGPARDPAGIRGLDDAPAALARIAAADALFVSRGDDSGTHLRERELWSEVGGPPPDGRGYLSAGQGQAKCLTIADEKQAYVLSDRGTFLALADHLDLEILVEGDPRLRNPYGAILVNPQRHPAARAEPARALLDYLTSPVAQRRIAQFTIREEALFHPAQPSG